MPKSTTQPELSVVVLCYKSGELAAGFYQRLKKDLEPKVDGKVEYVLVGNYWPGQQDVTPEIVELLAAENPNITAVTKIKQPGKLMGWDLRSGLEQATGKYIVFTDGDDQFDPKLVSQVYQQIKTGQYDLVKTRRIRRDDGWYRLLISRVYNAVFKIMFGGANFTDVNSKPKIITRAAYQLMKLQDNGWFIDAEMMLQAQELCLRVGEVPIEFRKNQHRASFVKADAIWEFVIKLLKYKARKI